jgi:hypothetical protein
VIKKYLVPIISALILGISFNALSQEVTKTGTTAAKFLSMGVGPRANAMGGAFSSIATDATAMYWNPAGLAQLNRYEGVFTYTKMFADINLNYFGIAIPVGDLGSLGINVTALSIGEMDVTTTDFPEGTGETFEAGSYAFGLTYARKITEGFLVGANIKYIRENIFNSSAEGFAVDIGTIFTTPFYDVRFSSSITNYGSKMRITGDDLLIRHDPDPQVRGNNETIDAHYSTEEFELPLRLQIGLSRDFYFFEEHRFTLSVDATHPNDNEQYVNIGGELALLNGLISLRGGYKGLFLSDSQEGLTLGAGFYYEGLEFFGIGVDYAFQEFEFLGNTHSFGLLLKF